MTGELKTSPPKIRCPTRILAGKDCIRRRLEGRKCKSRLAGNLAPVSTIPGSGRDQRGNMSHSRLAERSGSRESESGKRSVLRNSESFDISSFGRTFRNSRTAGLSGTRTPVSALASFVSARHADWINGRPNLCMENPFRNDVSLVRSSSGGFPNRRKKQDLGAAFALSLPHDVHREHAALPLCFPLERWVDP